jgi:hypothetical protein
LKSNDHHRAEGHVDVSDYLELVYCVLQDAYAMCTADASDLRDWKTIQARTEQEGMSFLTITLPSFAKSFERSLASGFVDPADFPGFRKSGAIPAFLQGMLGRLFSRESGRIFDHVPDHSILVDAVRQVCLLFKKVEMRCTPERENAAISNFLEVERANHAFILDPAARDSFLGVAKCLWPSVLGDLSPDMLVPRHGPGATAERVLGNQKFVWQRWHERLEVLTPFFGFAYSIGAAGEQSVLEKVAFVPEDQEQPVRVTLVPKTLKAPRIIAIEPACNQYVQQAVRDEIYSRIESYRMTRGRVNFRDQTVNQQLALMASETGKWATIDLSDASDRVLNDLALRMFDSHPDIQDIVSASRSKFAELPDGRLVGPLSKFASMGSALCFPVEAMYFYTACVVARLVWHNLPVTPANVEKMCAGVFVYGDDLIVPVDEAVTVVDVLQQYNCKVNSHKSFWTGRFRESCGTDAYAGKPVTPVYIRKLRPRNRRQAKELISWVATGNLFFQKGYWRTAHLMHCTCERFLGVLPHTTEDSPALGRIYNLGSVVPTRVNSDTQVLEQRAWVPSPVYRSDGIDGYPALTKCLLRLGNQGDRPSWLEVYSHGLVPETVDDKHLERSALRGEVTLKRRWVPRT